MTHWVGGVDQMPIRSIPMDLWTEGGLNTDADTPQCRRDNNLLLTPPNRVVKGFLAEAGVSSMGGASGQGVLHNPWGMLANMLRMLAAVVLHNHTRA